MTIGAGVLMAAYAYVIGGDHDFSDPARSVLDQSRTSSGVIIGDGAWLGAGAKVLDGVTIGSHAVIGAGAVVREAVPDRAVAVGVPARLVNCPTCEEPSKTMDQTLVDAAYDYVI